MNWKPVGLTLSLATSMLAQSSYNPNSLDHLAEGLGQCMQQKLGPATFRGNTQHTGVYYTRDVRANPELLWSFKTEGKVVSSPTILRGVAYVGSYDGHLYAVNAKSGELIWKFKTGGELKSTPAVWNDTVYFASQDGVFYAVSAHSGHLKWSFRTQDEANLSCELGIPWFPTGIDDSLYAMTHEQRFDRINDPWDCFYSSATLAQGLVYFGAWDGTVYALDARRGHLKWSFQTGSPVRSTPAVHHNTVFVGSFNGNLYALNAATGAEKWRRAYIPGEWSCPQIQSSPAVVDGVVYYGGRDSYIHAADAETGATRWMSCQDGNWVIASPAVHEGTVYTGTSDSSLMLALDAKTGTETWRFKAAKNIFASASICGRTLYFSEYNAYQYADASCLYALDLATGTEKWRYATQGSVSSPVIDDGVLYIGTEDGQLIALK